jgi:DNA-binding transcriptional MerR regulator
VTEPATDPGAAKRMRIDDLAHESGQTVDTIRYYQREGLLPPGEREGRHRVYGPDHLRRLARIKELQGRRFSIAAIRAFVSGDERRLEGVFADEGEGVQYGYDELVQRSGVDPDFATALRDAGVLRDPQTFGRVTYDGDDLEMLRAMAELHRAGFPAKVLAELGRIYGEGVESMQRQVVDVFSEGTGVDWTPGEFDEFRTNAEQQGPTMLVSMRRLVDYTHHRTIQRLTLDRVDPGVVTPDDPTSELPI